MERHNLEIKRSAVREIEGLSSKKIRRSIVDRISQLAIDLRPAGSEKPAGGDRYRVRQGPYRIVYEIDDSARVVRVVKVGHRRDVYRRWRSLRPPSDFPPGPPIQLLTLHHRARRSRAGLRVAGLHESLGRAG